MHPYQITHDILHRARTNNPKIYMEPLKTQNCRSNSEEQKPSRRHNSPRLQALLQSHNHQDSVVLVPKQTYRPMEQNREPRNKPRHLWSINLWQRRQEHKMGKRQSFQQTLLGNLDSCMQIDETRTHPHTMHKNKLKMAERLIKDKRTSSQRFCAYQKQSTAPTRHLPQPLPRTGRLGHALLVKIGRASCRERV